MPGGRGTIVDLATTLNIEDDAQADKACDLIKLTLDNDGYRFEGATLVSLAAAAQICTRPEKLAEIWCRALRTGRVDPAEY